MKLAIRRLDSRQGAKHAKFRTEKINYLEKNVYYFSHLCGLAVFAGDIPSFIAALSLQNAHHGYTPDKLPIV
jgi:hypothetical protein